MTRIVFFAVAVAATSLTVSVAHADTASCKANFETVREFVQYRASDTIAGVKPSVAYNRIYQALASGPSLLRVTTADREALTIYAVEDAAPKKLTFRNGLLAVVKGLGDFEDPEQRVPVAITLQPSGGGTKISVTITAGAGTRIKGVEPDVYCQIIEAAR